MQKLAVVYFPKTNLGNINSFREKYDPNWQVIPPHITIISPLSEVSENQLIEHIEDLVKDLKPFSIHLTGLIKTEDNLLFLLVKEGNEQIINLHNMLYSGILASYTPTDFPFIPHITLGDFKDKDSDLYTEAEKENFDITCIVDELSLIKGDGINPAEIVKKISLHS